MLTKADSLTTINLPSSIEKIKPYANSYMKSLTKINIENNDLYQSIDGVIYSADGKELVLFPQAKCEDFTVPQGVEAISEYAFSNSILKNITLPDTLKTIERFAFKNAGFAELYLPSSVSSAGARIMGDDKSKVVSVGEYNKGLENLELYNVMYRDDTMLKKAIRLADKKWEDVTKVFIDLNFDDFPELILYRSPLKTIVPQMRSQIFR